MLNVCPSCILESPRLRTLGRGMGIALTCSGERRVYAADFLRKESGMRIPLKRLFAAILPLMGLLLTAPLATTAQAEHEPGWEWRHSHHDYYRQRQQRGYYAPQPYWRGYSYRERYYYP